MTIPDELNTLPDPPQKQRRQAERLRQQDSRTEWERDYARFVQRGAAFRSVRTSQQ